MNSSRVAVGQIVVSCDPPICGHSWALVEYPQWFTGFARRIEQKSIQLPRT